MPLEKENDDLIEGLYQGKIETQIEKVNLKDFRPWHKPRKHFLRVHQWCHEAQILIKRLGIKSGSQFRYLGLPGEDMLDIRAIKGIFPPGVSLRYLGFNNSLKIELDIAQHEVNSDKVIDPSSVVIPDLVQTIANPKGMAYKYAIDAAPFDVINLDLQVSITDLSSAKIPHLDAIRQLCNIQTEKRAEPWLLLLTTRAIRENLDSDVKKTLFGSLIQNLDAHPAFEESLNNNLNVSKNLLEGELSNKIPLNNKSWLDIYVLAISKWLLKYMFDHGQSVSVRLLPSYVYSVKTPESPDMVSLAFYFERITSPREDKTGLTENTEVKEKLPTELELAIEMIEQVSKLEDVDIKIASDPELKRKVVRQIESLLIELHYDIPAYRKFISE